VTVQLLFRFADGSLDDETAVFSQRGHFRLLADRLVQRGPAFPHPLEMSLDACHDLVTVRYQDGHGATRVDRERMHLPPDLANGVLLTLLKNIPPGAPPEALSFVAATPRPRLVKLAITTAGRDHFSTGGVGRSATHYVVKVELGGLTGWLAPLLGKAPVDSHVWILGGEAPAFVKSEQPLYPGGPIWRIELVSPTWR